MIFLWLYRLAGCLLIPPAIPLLALQDKWRGKARPRWTDRFCRGELPETADLWIQAVSVGEVEVATQLVQEILARRPDLRILVTATTVTGLALAEKRLGGNCRLAACPVDSPGALSRFLKAATPKMLVLIETELWPEMLHQLGRRNIPVVIVNARLSEKSFRRYRHVRRALDRLLSPLSLVLARDRGDLERFRDLGIPERKLRLGGNLKYDIEADVRPLEWAEDFKSTGDERPVIVAGSTMEGEEEILLESLSSSLLAPHRPRLILAPRHPERFDAVAEMIGKRALSLSRRSAWKRGFKAFGDVFLLDSIGELARSYRLGNLAFLGGSMLGRGGHNPLESLLWGVPVLSGPSMENFEEIYGRLIGIDAVRTVVSAGGFAEAAAFWIEHPEEARAAGVRGMELIQSQQGATKSVSDLLLDNMEGAS